MGVGRSSALQALAPCTVPWRHIPANVDPLPGLTHSGCDLVRFAFIVHKHDNRLGWPTGSDEGKTVFGGQGTESPRGPGARGGGLPSGRGGAGPGRGARLGRLQRHRHLGDRCVGASIGVTGLEWQAWLGAALPAVLVGYVALFRRIIRVGGGLLVATYGAYLALTFR